MNRPEPWDPEEWDQQCESTHPEDSTLRCKLLAGHHYTEKFSGGKGEIHVGPDRRYWWYDEEPEPVVCYGPAETDIVDILPRIQIEEGNLEFHETPEENTYRITQETRFRIPPELLADLQPWQLDLVERAFHRYQEETREQIHAQMSYYGRTGRAYTAPKGADPDDPGSWQELGYISVDGLPLDHQHTYQQPAWFDEIHHFRDPAPLEITLHNVSDETRDLILGPPSQWRIDTPTWRRDPLPLQPYVPLDRGAPVKVSTPAALLARLRLRWEGDSYRRTNGDQD